MQLDQLLISHAEFLTSRGPKPAVLLVLRDPGIGTTTFVDRLHAELLIRGCMSMRMIDAPGRPTAHELRGLHQQIQAGDVECAVIVTDRPDDLELVLASVADVRQLRLPPLDQPAARALVEDLGIAPWSLRAAAVIAAGEGRPGRIVDHAIDDAYLHPRWPSTLPDRTFEPDVMPAGVSAWWRARWSGDVFDWSSLEQDLDVQAVRAEQLLEMGEMEAAAAIGRDGTDDESGAMRWLRVLSRAAAAACGDPRALLELHALAGAAARSGDAMLHVRARQLICMVAQRTNDRHTMRRALMSAIECADASRLLAAQLQLRVELAQLQLAERNPDDALLYASEVVEAAADAGYRRIRDDAARVVARAELRSSVAGRAHHLMRMPDIEEPGGVLTAREREVAHYVAASMTNPEIAAELGLSPRTVEHHVASILRKLELPSRRALIHRVV